VRIFASRCEWSGGFFQPRRRRASPHPTAKRTTVSGICRGCRRPNAAAIVCAQSPMRTEGGLASMGYLKVFFNSGTTAHITASWLSPRKIRRIFISGNRRMICYDEVEPHEKVKLYENCSVPCAQFRQGDRSDPGFRSGDALAQPIDQAEPLALLVQHFCDCVNGAAVPLCDGRAGLRTIEMLTAVDRSVADGGRRVPVTG
jgi:predicted dehydrogenase